MLDQRAASTMPAADRGSSAIAPRGGSAAAVARTIASAAPWGKLMLDQRAASTMPAADRGSCAIAPRGGSAAAVARTPACATGAEDHDA